MHAQIVPQSSPVVLDRAVAVVNDRAILASDVQNEIHLSILEPGGGERQSETPQEALERIISRTLIRQQIREEDEQSLVPTDKEVAERIDQIRNQLPVCVRANCASDTGWKNFLATHGLTKNQVEGYVRSRMETLRFIGVRFQQGIHISQEAIEDYYHNKLLPQYPGGEPVPPLDQVSTRIQEILLQQQVTELFSGWLDNLRSQGDIEVLDPSLEAAVPGSDHANPAQGVR
jgi:peptidyl-prolyl cis-trans isomerase SurA